MTLQLCVGSTYRVRAQLNILHDTFGLGWREIAKLPPFFGFISHTTISDAAAGKYPISGLQKRLRIRKFPDLVSLPPHVLSEMIRLRQEYHPDPDLHPEDLPDGFWVQEPDQENAPCPAI
jgi:hypothetical protein